MQVPRQLLTASILDFKTLSYYFNENQFSGFKDVSDMPDKFDTTLTLFSKLLPSYLRKQSCRDSSVGRASDWRSEGPWFKSGELAWALNNPGSRQIFFSGFASNFMKLQNFTSCYLKGATLYFLFSLSVMVTCRCYILRCYSRCYTGFCQDSSRLGKQLSPPHQRRDQLLTSDLEDNVLCPDSLLKRYPLTIT